MSRDRLAASAHAVMVGAAVLLFADLFLDWHRVTVSVGGVIDVEASTNAWNGWGAVTGVILAVLLIIEAADAAGLGRDRLRIAAVTSTLALAAAAFTVVELFSGDASVGVAGIVGVHVSTTLWPAWVALFLSAVLAAAGAYRLASSAEEAAPTGRLLPH